jgi:hypothetical protein
MGLDRAIAALGMYGAIEAIERIEDALVGITDDHSGTCPSWERPIPVERLEMTPGRASARAGFTADDTPARSRRGTRHGERTDAFPPLSNGLDLVRIAHDPRVLAESQARHPSSVRHEPAPHDEQSPISTRGPNRDAAS